MGYLHKITCLCPGGLFATYHDAVAAVLHLSQNQKKIENIGRHRFVQRVPSWESVIFQCSLGQQRPSPLNRICWASLVAQTVKNLPAMWKAWVRSLGWEDPLDETMATQSNILTWKNSHGQRSLGGYSPWGRKESDTTKHSTLVISNVAGSVVLDPEAIQLGKELQERRLTLDLG